MSSLQLRPRVATEIVDAAFQLYGRHFTALFTLSLAIFAPYIVIEYAVTSGLAPNAATVGGVMLMLLSLAGWIVASFSEAAIVVAVSNSYLNGDPAPRSALRLTLSRFFVILFAVFSKWFVIAVATGLCFAVFAVIATLIGGAAALASGGGPPTVLMAVLIVVAFLAALPLAAFLYARYFAVPATIVLEGLGVRAGLSRSSKLSVGMKPRILGALGLTMLVFFIIQMVVYWIAQLLPGPVFVGFLFQKLPAILISPIMAVIATLLYYDARIRKEGFDIERMAAELSSIGADVPPAQLSV